MADIHNGMDHWRRLPVDKNRMREFLKNGREHQGSPAVSGHLDFNADLIWDAGRLYIPDGANVLDLTLGKGAFWSTVNTDRFNLYGSDIREYSDEERERLSRRGVKEVFDDDFRQTRWAPHTFDVVVFDPPYRSGGSTSHAGMVDTYGLTHLDSKKQSRHGNRDIVWDLYVQGMYEAFRVLLPRGLMFVKCQDFVESGKQHWFHIEIFQHAKAMGMKVQDLFTLSQTKTPLMRHTTQRHARKTVSYMWVFQKW